MERIVWIKPQAALEPVIYRIGATMYRDPASNSPRTIPHIRAEVSILAAGGHQSVLPGSSPASSASVRLRHRPGFRCPSLTLPIRTRSRPFTR
jgi:hypothetical protein